MIDYLLFEDLRDAMPVDNELDTADKELVDIQKLMFKEHPELDPDFDMAFTEYYCERDIDVINCTIRFEKESKYISELNCSKETKSKLFLKCLDSYNDALCDMGG